VDDVMCKFQIGLAELDHDRVKLRMIAARENVFAHRVAVGIDR